MAKKIILKYLIFAILIVGAIFRFYHIDFQSLWLDEIHTLNVADPAQSVSQLFTGLNTSDPHPPLYFCLIYICFKVFGYTTYVLRMFSAVIGIAGIYALYAFGKEFFDRKIGLVAAALVAVNFFHIYFSQEGRMYSLLFLTTTISFIFLLRFLRNPNIRTSLLFAVFSTLMIYSHLFAVFTLVAQYAILGYFIIFPYKTTWKKMLGYSVMNGILTIILYIPVLIIIMANTKRDSIWILLPEKDVYVQYFEDFFGGYSVLYIGAFLFLILYFVAYFRNKNKSLVRINPETDTLPLSVLLFSLWIVITLAIPFILSYLTLPMLVNRYFINVLPAVLVMIAVGICAFKNKYIQAALLTAFLFFSVKDLVWGYAGSHYQGEVGRQRGAYYNAYSKSQFRDVAAYVVTHNPDFDPFVSGLGWFYRYFIISDNVRTQIVEKPLQDYVNDMMSDPSKKKSFWYADAHNRPYTIDAAGQKYLDDNFTVTESQQLFDAWAKHYVLKK